MSSPSHRNADEPQPEYCALCGQKISALRLKMSEVEGLRGRYICDQNECGRLRSALTHADKRRGQRIPTTVGQGRILPADAADWLNDQDWN